MKIIADVKKCCGHARCASVDDSLFVLDDNGYIAVSEIQVPAGQEALARRGARACPERALTVQEDAPPAD
jgi:ferredoxin